MLQSSTVPRVGLLENYRAEPLCYNYNPILIKHLMCQVQLLVSLQCLRRVGEQKHQAGTDVEIIDMSA